ncbi:MAG: radical SAM family heme chaperone HemW [Magnetococcales bacterium]|nr:radical SAM family heme chaperone HemW [Magnetococcales bacterium]
MRPLFSFDGPEPREGAEQSSPTTAQSLAIYVHVPFCRIKCHYCAYHSVTHCATDSEAWFQGLLRDLDFQARAMNTRERRVTSIFLGGGTPSILSPRLIGGILEHIVSCWSLDRNVEITLEANPESTDLSKLSEWRACGVNRLSLGVQAFDDHRLDVLGRPHSVHQARTTFAAARRAGFDNINLDLIHGSPGHTLDLWRDELDCAMNLEPEHLSCYALSVEPGTFLDRKLQDGRWVLPDAETAADLYLETLQILGSRGWERYEISNHARNRRYCRHNLEIWRSGDYLGAGPAAHGRITLAGDHVIRCVNHWPLEAYLRATRAGRSPHAWIEYSPPEEEAGLCLLMGLRLSSGISRRLYHRIAGKDLAETKKEEVDFLVEEGFLELDDSIIRLTARGLDFLDDCLVRLI